MSFFNWLRLKRSKKGKVKRIGFTEQLFLNCAYNRNRKQYVPKFKINEKYDLKDRNLIDFEYFKNQKLIYDVSNYPLTVVSDKFFKLLKSGENNDELYLSRPSSIFDRNTLILNKDTYVIDGDYKSVQTISDSKNISGKKITKENDMSEITNLTVLSLFKEINDKLYGIHRKLTKCDSEDNYFKKWLDFLFINKFEYSNFYISSKYENESHSIVCIMIFFKSNMNSSLIISPTMLSLLMKDHFDKLTFYNHATLPIDLFTNKMEISSRKINDFYCVMELTTEWLQEMEYYTQYFH